MVPTQSDTLERDGGGVQRVAHDFHSQEAGGRIEELGYFRQHDFRLDSLCVGRCVGCTLFLYLRSPQGTHSDRDVSRKGYRLKGKVNCDYLKMIKCPERQQWRGKLSARCHCLLKCRTWTENSKAWMTSRRSPQHRFVGIGPAILAIEGESERAREMAEN